eukprot:scaffold22680_cov107-Cylindrotheca_fusiformis.AAC.28
MQYLLPHWTDDAIQKDCLQYPLTTSIMPSKSRLAQPQPEDNELGGRSSYYLTGLGLAKLVYFNCAYVLKALRPRKTACDIFNLTVLCPPIRMKTRHSATRTGSHQEDSELEGHEEEYLLPHQTENQANGGTGTGGISSLTMSCNMCDHERLL